MVERAWLATISRVRRALALPVAGLIAAASGCGGGGLAKPAALPGPSEQLLTQKDVDRYAKGTPARAFTLWWRNAQYANQTAFVQSFAAPLRQKFEAAPERTQQALSSFSGAIRTSRPVIENVTRGGGKATVYVLINKRHPVGATRFITTTLPRAFTMLLEDGMWRLRDDLLVQENIPVRKRF
jgi:hypothetical protein